MLTDDKLTKIENSIDKHLRDRHWGIRANGDSYYGRPRFYIMDYRGLSLATGIIRFNFFKHGDNSQIFYRGQEQDWELRPSLYRDCETCNDIELVNCWRNHALECIKPHFDITGTDEEREALAQHYGLKTQFIDVVDHIQTALWFAYDKVERAGERSRHDESVGYVQVIAVPSGATVIDLRRKPSEWLRPHIQQGFSVRLQNPDKDLGRASKYVVATFIISRENLYRWSNYANIPRSYIYPSPALDRGAEYWAKAKNELDRAGLMTAPKLK